MPSTRTRNGGAGIAGITPPSHNGGGGASPPAHNGGAGGAIRPSHYKSDGVFLPARNGGADVTPPPHYKSGGVFPNARNGGAGATPPSHYNSGGVFPPAHNGNAGFMRPSNYKSSGVFLPACNGGVSDITPPPHFHSGGVFPRARNGGADVTPLPFCYGPALPDAAQQRLSDEDYEALLQISGGGDNTPPGGGSGSGASSQLQMGEGAAYMDWEAFIASTQLQAAADMGAFISDVQVQLFEAASCCRTASFLDLYREMMAAGIDMRGMKDECGNSLLLVAVKKENAVEADRYPIVRYERRVDVLG